MYETYKGKVDFYLIYTKEAHASDGRRPSKNVIIKNHVSIEDRTAAANSCIKDLKLTIPTLVDDMEDSVARAYSGHPDRLFIIGENGKIVYRGDQGPRGFNAEEMQKKLIAILKPTSR